MVGTIPSELDAAMSITNPENAPNVSTEESV